MRLAVPSKPAQAEPKFRFGKPQPSTGTGTGTGTGSGASARFGEKPGSSLLSAKRPLAADTGSGSGGSVGAKVPSPTQGEKQERRPRPSDSEKASTTGRAGFGGQPPVEAADDVPSPPRKQREAVHAAARFLACRP